MNAELPRRVEVAPMSPEMPAAWTDEIFEGAYAHAAELFPHEAAGIVEAGAYVRLANTSVTPGEDVRLGDDDLVRVANSELFFHSHPNGHACPSEQDMIYQQQLGVPFVVMTLPHYDLFAWGDMLAKRPLLGRGFRHGVHDCYALIRDWYLEHGITKLWDQPRGWEWWSGKEHKNLYSENFAAAGFHKIDPATATRAGDVVLFNFNYPVPMHGGIVVDRDLIMHHAAGVKPADSTRLSKLEPALRLRRFITVALRHEDLSDDPAD